MRGTEKHVVLMAGGSSQGLGILGKARFDLNMGLAGERLTFGSMCGVTISGLIVAENPLNTYHHKPVLDLKF